MVDHSRDAVVDNENNNNHFERTGISKIQKKTVHCCQAFVRQSFAALYTERFFSLVLLIIIFVLFFEIYIYIVFVFVSGMPTVDRFLSHLGDPGRYQVIIMILMAANCIPVVVNHLLMAFYVPFKHTSNHNCRVGCLNVYIHT